MCNKKQYLVLQILNIIFPLIIGLIIYYLDGASIIVFDVLGIKTSPVFEHCSVLKFLRNHICDAIWAYCLFFSLNFITKAHNKSLFISIIFCIAIECFQKTAILAGTFDIIDIVLEIIAIIIALSISLFFIKEKKHENKT